MGLSSTGTHYAGRESQKKDEKARKKLHIDSCKRGKVLTTQAWLAHWRSATTGGGFIDCQLHGHRCCLLLLPPPPLLPLCGRAASIRKQEWMFSVSRPVPCVGLLPLAVCCYPSCCRQSVSPRPRAAATAVAAAAALAELLSYVRHAASKGCGRRVTLQRSSFRSLRGGQRQPARSRVDCVRSRGRRAQFAASWPTTSFWL